MPSQGADRSDNQTLGWTRQLWKPSATRPVRRKRDDREICGPPVKRSKSACRLLRRSMKYYEARSRCFARKTRCPAPKRSRHPGPANPIARAVAVKRDKLVLLMSVEAPDRRSQTLLRWWINGINGVRNRSLFAQGRSARPFSQLEIRSIQPVCGQLILALRRRPSGEVHHEIDVLKVV